MMAEATIERAKEFALEVMQAIFDNKGNEFTSYAREDAKKRYIAYSNRIDKTTGIYTLAEDCIKDGHDAILCRFNKYTGETYFLYAKTYDNLETARKEAEEQNMIGIIEDTETNEIYTL